MKRLWVVPPLIGLACTPITSTATIPPGVDCGPEPTKAQVVGAIRSWVNNVGLKDPASAQIKGIRLVGQRGWSNALEGGKSAYGWEIEFQANSKNSYGGYVGFRTRTILLTPDGQIHWHTRTE